MDGSGALILYAMLFVGVLLAFDGFMQLTTGHRGDDDEAINKRLRMLASGADPEEVLRLLRRRRPRSWVDRVPFLRDWTPLVVQSGIQTPPGRVMLIMLAVTLALAVVFAVLGWGILVALLLAVALGMLLPYLYLRIKRGQRINELRRQLPDAIDLMVRSLRAGYPLAASFQVIANEMSDPIGTEFGLVADAITYGDELTDAVLEFVDRVQIEEAAYLGVAINIQAGTGGNLANVLQALSTVIRDRFAMLRKVRAVSSEGRITAWVVSAAPFIIFFALQLLVPSYYGDVDHHWLYDWMLGVGVGLTIINALVLRKLVNFHF